MSISIQEFEKIIDEAEGRLVQNIRASLIKNALRMEAAAKKNATSFPRVQTGRLRNSIIGSVIQILESLHIQHQLRLRRGLQGFKNLEEALKESSPNSI